MFEEVATGYTYEMAVEEARRCLHCKNKPCVTACPVQIDIPAFIEKVANEDMEGAFEILNKQSSLPAVCGRVCPQETQCEVKCVRGIKGEPVGIGRLERFVADWHREHNAEKPVPPASNGHKVAVIGAGPAGLTCAGDLARMGYKVTIYEALHVAGGVLSYGIPEFRLPKAIVNSEVDNLRALGVDIETDMVIGKVLTIDELFDDMGFEAVFIGSGAGLPRFMGIPGESLKGVYSANEFLTRINLMKAYLPDSKTPIRHGNRVAVVGGGNVAMDAARCAKRLGAEEVYIVYRRGMQELPARREEVEHAEEEGIIFKTLTNPVEVLGYNNPEDPRDPRNGEVVGMKCVEMELGEPDASGRRRPIVKEGRRVYAGHRHDDHGAGHQPEPADPLDHARPRRRPPRLHHHQGRGRPDQPRGRLRRRRRRHRRGHRHPRDGRGQECRRRHRRVHQEQELNRSRGTGQSGRFLSGC